MTTMARGIPNRIDIPTSISAVPSSLLPLLSLLILAACGSRTGLLYPRDATVVAIDGGGIDAGSRPDFGTTPPVDFGPPPPVDFGPPPPIDFGLPPFDFGLPPLDLGPPPIDLGPPDLGPPDLGPPDAGPPATLHGLRAELPCMGPLMGGLCPTPATSTDVATLMGTPGTSYDVAFQIRGVTEGRRYAACTTTMGSWCTSSETPSRSDNYNVWGLTIGTPAQQYFLNHGMEAPESFVMDYVQVLRVASGATVTLTGDSINSAEFPNRDAAGVPVVVSGVPPDPMAFDGEFVQIDVLSIVPAP